MIHDYFEMLTPEELSKLQSIIDPDDEIQSVSIVFKTGNYYYVKKSKKIDSSKKSN